MVKSEAVWMMTLDQQRSLPGDESKVYYYVKYKISQSNALPSSEPCVQQYPSRAHKSPLFTWRQPFLPRRYLISFLAATRRAVRQTLRQASSPEVHVPFLTGLARTTTCVQGPPRTSNQLVLPDAPGRILAPADAALSITLVEAHGPVAVSDDAGAEPVDEGPARGGVVSATSVAPDVVGATAWITRKKVKAVIDAALGARWSGKPAERAVAKPLCFDWLEGGGVHVHRSGAAKGEKVGNDDSFDEEHGVFLTARTAVSSHRPKAKFQRQAYHVMKESWQVFKVRVSA